MAAQLRDQMRRENVEPDRTTYTFMINMYGRKGMYQEIIDTFQHMRSSSCVLDRNVCHLILTAHSKLGTSSYSFEFFRFAWDSRTR